MRAIRKGLLVVLCALALPACGGGGGETSAQGDPEGEVALMEEGNGARAGVPQSGGGELAVAGASISDDLSSPGDFDRKIVKTAELVLLVPSPEFETALGELRGLGKKVTTDTVSGEDVTEEFVDLESRERNLLAAEQSLLELYERAESVNAALAIERELTIIRGEIEQVQGRMQYLEDRTASSRISLSIEPLSRPAPPPPAWSPARVVAHSWEASLAVLQALATAVLSVLVFGWWLAPVLILGFVLWRRHTRRPAAPGSSEAG